MQDKMPRSLREQSKLPADGWSDWVRAIVPPKEPKELVGQRYKYRSTGQIGEVCTNIKKALPDKMKECGIYEWQARGTFVGQPDKVVVYVGSTCAAKRGSLSTRVLQYCTNGSHKSTLINDALKRGYEFWFRVKTSSPKNPNHKLLAQEMENELLEKYDYAWNVRNNAIRDML